MSFWTKLFGAKAPEAAPGIDHAGFTIYPEPEGQGNRWRIGARIEKEVNGTLMTHQMIRADTLDSAEAARDASLAKARMLVDQQGEAIFG